jgi:hypothetical protein
MELISFLFLMRFICCNVANSEWQHLGKNITGLALGLGLAFSLWSLLLTGSDAMYCRYPTRTGYHDAIEGAADGSAGRGYCTIYHESLPASGVPSKEFMQDCSLHERTGWNASAVLFRQRFLPGPPMEPTPRLAPP